MNEIKVNPPNVFRPGQQVYYSGIKFYINNNPNYYKGVYEDSGEEYYIINDPNTGERFRIEKINYQ